MKALRHEPLPETQEASLSSNVRDISALSDLDREQMFDLYSKYYTSTAFALFLKDLSEKTAVVLLFDETGRICGFSTLLTYDFLHQGERVGVVFSGDTIIAREHWGSQTFAFTWIRHIGKIAAARPDVPLYWFLIVKGHRTYRYLPAFGLKFVPDWRGDDDQKLTSLKDALAFERFGSAYDPETGILHFDESKGELSSEWSDASEREKARPDVRFFLERNPGYTQGDELVCLCELSLDNMRPLTRRIFTHGVRT